MLLIFLEGYPILCPNISDFFKEKKERNWETKNKELKNIYKVLIWSKSYCLSYLRASRIWQLSFLTIFLPCFEIHIDGPSTKTVHFLTIILKQDSPRIFLKTKIRSWKLILLQTSQFLRRHWQCFLLFIA